MMGIFRIIALLFQHWAAVTHFLEGVSLMDPQKRREMEGRLKEARDHADANFGDTSKYEDLINGD